MNFLKQTSQIINYFKIKNINTLIVLMIFVSLLEVIGVGIIIPFVSVILDQDLMVKYYSFFGVETLDYKLSTIILSSLIIIFFLIKNFFVIFAIKKQYGIALDILTKIRTELFRRFITQDYELFVNRSSSNILNIITNVALNFSTVFFVSLLVFLSETLIVLSILLVVLIYEFKTSLALIILFALVCFVYFKFISPRLKSSGVLRIEGEENIIKYTKLGLQNLKELKIYSKENFFMEYFVKNVEKASKASLFFNTSSNFPRIGIELFAIISMCLVVIIMTINNFTSEKIISTLAFYGVAIFRILPSINKIMFAYQSIRFSKKNVDLITDELFNMPSNQLENISQNKEINFKSEIRIENISFAYQKNKDKKILKNISFKINKGDKVAIIGESGSGKSTLIDILLGLLKPDEGKIIVDGTDIKENFKSWQKNCSYVSQNLFFLDDTIEKNIAFGYNESEIEKNSIYKTLKDTQLYDFVMSQKNKEGTVLGDNGLLISGGQRQRIAIARAIYNNPNIIFFDEATSSLDKDTENKILECIFSSEFNKTIIFVTHNTLLTNHCNKIFKISNESFETIKNN
tara:strand:+ start:1421 stop:3145 length:1725 start_codon:yes stop_codon:yes gene_type:complete